MNLDTTQQGQLTGRFYGPAAQEVGAVFDTTAGGNNAIAATGVILGRNATASADTDFGSLTGVDLFTADRVRQSAGGTASFGTAQIAVIPFNPGNVDVMVTGPDYTVTTNVGSGLSVTSSPAQTMATVVTQPNGTKGFQLLSPSNAFVQAGVWFDTTGAAPSYDDLVFGFVTPTSQIPPTGYADYTVALDAIVQKAGTAPYEATGAGRLGIEFGTGAITTQGALQTAGSNGASLGNLSGTAALMSSTSAFSGNLTTTGATNWSGTWQGHLYGPSGTLVGAVFDQTGSDGSTIAGVMTGTYTDNVDPSITLSHLPGVTTFRSNQALLAIISSDPIKLEVGLTSPAPQVSYDPSSNTYTVTGYGPSGAGLPNVSAVLNSSALDPANSSAEFTAYSAPGLTARVLTSGSSNPTIQLSYTSFVEVTLTGGGSAGTSPYRDINYIPFGIATQSMPTTGTGSYSGAVYGTSVTTPLGATQLNTSAITGTGTLNANFATLTVNSTLNLNAAGGTSLGTYSFSGSVIGNSFNATETLPQAGYGVMQGAFYGPAANEVGASWAITVPGNGNVNNPQTQMIGAFVAKKN